MHPSTAFAATTPRRHARRRSHHHRLPLVQRLLSRRPTALVALLTSVFCAAVLVGSVGFAVGGA